MVSSPPTTDSNLGPATPVESFPQLESFPRLARAPITEAVIYFRAVLPTQFDMGVFQELHAAELQGDYPTIEPEMGFEQTIQFGPGGARSPSPVRSLGVAAYRLHSVDRRSVAQFRRDGFSFSRLKPYTSWEEVFGAAWRLWEIYRDIAVPSQVAQISLRYINRLPLPLDRPDLRLFLKAPPVVPLGWPTRIGGFFSQVILHDPEADAVATVVQTLEKQKLARDIPVILDINVQSKGGFNPADPTLAERFLTLRRLKNRIFFGGLTDEATRLFQ